MIASYREAMEENLTWILTITDSLETNAMRCLFLNNYENKPLFNKEISQTLPDQFHQIAFETIRKALYKNKIQNVKTPAVRSQVTKFRLSKHSLMIELSRLKEIPKELRFCQLARTKLKQRTTF